MNAPDRLAGSMSSAVNGSGSSPARARERTGSVLCPRPRLLRGALVGAVLVAAGCAHGGQPAGREIVWEGNVNVREDLLVGVGETLVVRPGTRVTFAFRDDDRDGAGDARIVVRGAIVAPGRAGAPIEFVAERVGSPGGRGWAEILIEDGAGASFAHCRFSGARQAVHAHRTALLVERCRFEDNDIGVRFMGDPVTIRNSAFARNGTAVRFWESSPEIAANVFTGNGTAVFVREGSPRTVITGNNFEDSADYHVKLGESQHADVDARGNWWGSTRPEEIERLLFDRLDADYLGRVRYDDPAPGPWRTAGP